MHGRLGSRPWSSDRSAAAGWRVSRLGLGTMTWGRDTDADDAAAQLKAFLDAGGTLVDTADVVRRRRRRVADRPAARRTWSRATTGASPPRPAADRPGRGRRRDGSRGAPADRAGRVAAAARHRLTSTCGRCTPSTRGRPLEETLAALDLAVSQRPGPLRRGVQLLPAGRPRRGRHLAARLARPGARWSHPGGVLAAGARRRARGAARRAWARARPAALVAAGPRGAHRQVPARRPGRLPGRVAAPARRSSATYLDRRGRQHRGGGGDRGRRPRRLAAARWRWPGSGTGPASAAPILGARTVGQLLGALAADAIVLPAEIRNALDDVSAPPVGYPEQ